MRRPRSWAVVLLALPLLVYLIPLVEGYAWSAVGSGFNVLDPPEGYTGRLPEMRITVEAWGASVVIVPLHAKIRDYLLAGELPLWNPYQGLGQPFAAQGEGSPYFPTAILRSLLPYSLANYVTVGMFWLSSAFLYRFLRGLGASRPAAAFGGAIWPLSGALSLHLARPNIADQLCMIPVLMWATERVVRARSVERCALLAIVCGLHAVAGFIQIAMIAGLGAVAFAAAYARALRPTRWGWLRDAALVVGTFVLGNGLAAFSLLPMLEAIRTSFNKNYPLLAFLTIPEANLIAFFAPYVFGYPFEQSWIPGEYPKMVSWDNLYAFAGLSLALAPLAVLPSVGRLRRPERWVFCFFVGAAVFLILRYLSVAPVAMVSLLPVLDRQSPKHSNGMAVFCLVVAASLAIDMLGRANRRRGRLVMGLFVAYLGSLLLTIVGRQGGFAAISPVSLALLFVALTLAVAAAAAFGVDRVLGRPGGPRRAAVLLGGIGVAELGLYVPLGNASPEFLAGRLAIGGLVVVAAVLSDGARRRLAVVPVLAAVVGYAALIALPERGLPRQFEADAPPAFMRWLAANTGPEDRSFGIMPDASATARLQDVSAVGPLAPTDFFRFVGLIADERTAREYELTTHFMLAGPWQLDLAQYVRVKPILDWVGVRHLVLNRQIFEPDRRTDDAVLLADPASFRVAYQDDRVTIVESLGATDRAEFWPAVTVAFTQDQLFADLRADPESILGIPRVELEGGLLAGLDRLATNIRTGPKAPGTGTLDARPTSVAVRTYRPGTVELEVDAPSAGLVVLKDVYHPGWSATVDRQPAAVVRVNGFARGVLVPEAGRHTIRFEYLPASFVVGVWVALAVATFLTLVVVSGRLAAPRRGDRAARAPRNPSGAMPEPAAAMSVPR